LHQAPALYVSHDVAEAFQLAEDVVVIDHGRIVAQGPADVVLATRREELLRQLGGAGVNTRQVK
jgi:ABC-type molybdate transport system ATPase subunit